MEIEGTYTLQAVAEEIWNCLLDQQIIQHAIPGMERLTRVDEHTYTFAIQIHHAPLRGTYTGQTRVLAPGYPSSYRLHIEGEGPSNKFSCECDIRLQARNENTVISYQGNLHLGRDNPLVPAPLLKATVKVLLQQFFATLTDQLRASRGDRIYVTTPEERYEGTFMEEQISESLAGPYSAQRSTLHRLVHLLHLGGRDSEAEEQWVRRIRQAGIVAALLLLLWVGTRLPRHPARS